MPNRIIKESTFTSDKVAQLSDFEFRLWVGLITQADDAGRGDARPAIIKGHIFALRERVTIKDIENSLHALAVHGCVDLYTVGGKPYYAFPSWAEHQRVRDVKPKYPSPDEADLTDCGGLPQIAADCRLNPIQSNTNPNPKECVTRTRAKFVKPTLEEVQAYCKERGNNVNAERFIAYYDSCNWVVGKKTMTDWKASVRYWETNGVSDKPTKGKAQSFDVDEAMGKALGRVYGGAE